MFYRKNTSANHLGLRGPWALCFSVGGLGAGPQWPVLFGPLKAKHPEPVALGALFFGELSVARLT